MTIAELDRLIKSKRRIQKKESQEKASYDYLLADLIGRSIARIYNSSNSYPEINEVYPGIFEETNLNEKKQEKVMELSALRFKQFAASFNKHFKVKEGTELNE